jgi:hypothetical protein
MRVVVVGRMTASREEEGEEGEEEGRRGTRASDASQQDTTT